MRQFYKMNGYCRKGPKVSFFKNLWLNFVHEMTKRNNKTRRFKKL